MAIGGPSPRPSRRPAAPWRTAAPASASLPTDLTPGTRRGLLPRRCWRACARPPPSAWVAVERACGWAGTGRTRGGRHLDIDPGSWTRIARIVEVGAEAAAAWPSPTWAAGPASRRAKRLRLLRPPAVAAAVHGAIEGEVGPAAALRVEPVYRSVDTCAGEFEASTPTALLDLRGGDRGPGQPAGTEWWCSGRGPTGSTRVIEFDDRLCPRRPGPAGGRLRDGDGQLQPRDRSPPTTTSPTASTVEPLTCEDVLEVCRGRGRRSDLVGVIVTMGGQTPLQLAQRPARPPGCHCSGRPPDAIDLAEDRGRLRDARPERCGLDAPPWGPGGHRGAGPGRRRPGRLPSPCVPTLRARRPLDGGLLSTPTASSRSSATGRG